MAVKSSEKSSDLGPDMKLYGDRANQLREMDQLRKEKLVASGHGGSRMTQEEKEKKLQEMQAASMALRD